MSLILTGAIPLLAPVVAKMLRRNGSRVVQAMTVFAGLVVLALVLVNPGMLNRIKPIVTQVLLVVGITLWAGIVWHTRYSANGRINKIAEDIASSKDDRDNLINQMAEALGGKQVALTEEIGRIREFAHRSVELEKQVESKLSEQNASLKRILEDVQKDAQENLHRILGQIAEASRRHSALRLEVKELQDRLKGVALKQG